MNRIKMCGEEIVRLASCRRKGVYSKPVIAGDEVYKLIRATLDTVDPTIAEMDADIDYYLD